MKKSEFVIVLKEAIQQGMKEAMYPAGFNAEEFKVLPSFKARIEYAMARLPKIAGGSSRAVFTIDNETVLKVALNKKGLAQNENEADVGRFSNSYPVAKVFEVGEKYTWLEMEKAKKATPKIFQQVAGIDFTTFAEVVRYWDLSNKAKAGFLNKPTDYDKLVSGSNELLNDVFGLMADYQLQAGDIIRISSWGVTRDGQQKLVLIDFGLTEGVWTDFYTKNKF